MANESKVIEMKLLNIEEAIKNVDTLTAKFNEQRIALAELKSAKDKDLVAIEQQKISIEALKKEIKVLTGEIANEVKERVKRAAIIDKNANAAIKAEQQAANEAQKTALKQAQLAMKAENEDRRRKDMIEKQSLAETIAEQKAEQLAKKRIASEEAFSAKQQQINQKEVALLQAKEQKQIALNEAEKARKAKLIMQIENEDRRRQAMIEKQSLAETLASQKAEQQAAKKVGYINELRLSVDRLEQEYYQLTKAELENVNVGGKMLNELKEKRSELSNLQAAYGKHNLNVGNYSSATKMLGINLGQVMKEMPNFAISARIGIMSLTNNLPMLAESIKAVRMEQQALAAEGKTTQSMIGMIGKSVFGLTGIMSLLMVAFQIFGPQIADFIKDLFKGKEVVDQLSASINKLNESVTGKMATEMEKIVSLAVDYNKASRDGDKERIKGIEEIALKEYGVQKERLKSIADNVNNWRDAFSEYLELSKMTYQNEFRIKEGAEIEYANKKLQIQRDLAKKAIVEKLQGFGYSEVQIYDEIKMLESGEKRKFGVFSSGLNKLGEEYTKTNDEIIENNRKLNALTLIELNDVYSKKEDLEKNGAKSSSDKQKATFDYEQELRDASARAIQESFEKEIELLNNKNILKQEKLKKAYDDDLVSKQEFDTLYIAYENKLNEDIFLVWDKRQKEFVKLQEKALKEGSDALKYALTEEEKLNEDYIKKVNSYLKINEDAKIEANRDDFAFEQAKLDDEYLMRIEAAKKIGADTYAIEEAYKVKTAMLTSEKFNAQLQLVSSFIKNTTGLYKQGTKEQKRMTTAQIMVDGVIAGYQAFNVAAYKSGIPVPYNYIAGGLAAAGVAVATGTAIRDVWAVDENGGSGSSNNQKTTVTEKFHTGKELGADTQNSKLKSDEIHSTILKAETVLRPDTSQVFNSILSNIQSLGGSQTITSGIGGGLNQADLIEIAVGRALEKMPAPQVIWKDYKDFDAKMAKFEQNKEL